MEKPSERLTLVTMPLSAYGRWVFSMSSLQSLVESGQAWQQQARQQAGKTPQGLAPAHPSCRKALPRGHWDDSGLRYTLYTTPYVPLPMHPDTAAAISQPQAKQRTASTCTFKHVLIASGAVKHALSKVF